MMKFPNKLYVGFKEKATLDTAKYPLGFATPYGTDKAFEKRKQTVDYWSGGWGSESYEGIVIDNTPLEGFLLTNVEERSTTSNKLFRLQDPRGMTLEISAENMLSLMLTGKVENGLIDGPCVWGRDGSTNWLTRANDPYYVSSLAPPKATLDVGDIVDIPHYKGAVYLGLKYVAVMDRRMYVPPGMDYRRIKHQDATFDITKTVIGPVHCFDANKSGSNYTMVYDKLPSFVFRESGTANAFRVGTLIGKKVYSYFCSFLFDTKEEAKEFKYDPEVHGEEDDD